MQFNIQCAIRIKGLRLYSKQALADFRSSDAVSQTV
jgi:hypothetical protein